MMKMNKIKVFYYKNREEILDSVASTKQCGKRKKERNEEIKKREERRNIIPLIMGGIYVILGVALWWILMQGNIISSKPQTVVISCELIILGIYALSYALLFYCVQGRWREKCLVNIIKEILIFIIFPYHLCIKGIKKILKEKKQDYVVQLFPYYFISLLLVMFTFVYIIHFISKLEISKVLNETIGFFIVLFLICEFFLIGRFIARWFTKSVIKSVQKSKLKRTSKKIGEIR